MGGGRARWGMGIKEGSCYDELWVLYASDKSLNFTPGTYWVRVSPNLRTDIFVTRGNGNIQRRRSFRDRGRCRGYSSINQGMSRTVDNYLKL